MAELPLPRSSAPARSLLAALTASALFLICSPAPARAAPDDKKKPTATGRIEISTTPGGYPVLVDGRPAGETTDFVRTIDLEPGAHTVEILFPNNTPWRQTFNLTAGSKRCIALNYRPTTISIPAVPVSPCPYPVNVSAPASANDGDVITFSADVGYSGPSALNYTWTVSPPTARILSGAGTPTITVDSSGLGGRRVTAILVAHDGSGERSCRQTAQSSTSVSAPPKISASPRRFDEFPSVAFDDVKARLDLFAVELQNSPGATGHVVAYAGRAARPGRAGALGARAKNYLVNERGISAGRLVVTDGGQRERDSYELWLVPPGAPPPRPSQPAAPEGRGRMSPPPGERNGPRGGEAVILPASLVRHGSSRPQQAVGPGETVDLGEVGGTVCDCGEAPAPDAPRRRKRRLIFFEE